MNADQETPSRPVVGALLLLAAVVAFTVTDALAKQLSGHHGAVQVSWARYVFFTLPLLVTVRPSHWLATLRTDRPLLQIARAMLPVGASLAIITGLATIPLADATAILFAAPLMITILSVPMLGEHVGIVRWAAVVCGFIGVVIVARPGAGIIGWAALWPFVGALFLALYQITTRILAKTADTRTTLAYTAVVGTVATTAVVPFFWTTPNAAGWMLLVVSGLLFGAAHLLLIQAFNYAEASVLAPLNYTQIMVATVLGVLVFGEFPDAFALFGMLVVVGAGLLVFVRQRRKQPG